MLLRNSIINDIFEKQNRWRVKAVTRHMFGLALLFLQLIAKASAPIQHKDEGFVSPKTSTHMEESHTRTLFLI